MDARVKHYFKRFRDHQKKVWADGGGMLTTYPGGRTELSYASAPYGEHALNAIAGAHRHIAFLKRLKGYVK